MIWSSLNDLQGNNFHITLETGNAAAEEKAPIRIFGTIFFLSQAVPLSVVVYTSESLNLKLLQVDSKDVQADQSFNCMGMFPVSLSAIIYFSACHRLNHHL